MTDKKRLTKAGATDLHEEELSEIELDHIRGGAGERITLKAGSTRSKKAGSSAVGIHEITGALIKIN